MRFALFSNIIPSAYIHAIFLLTCLFIPAQLFSLDPVFLKHGKGPIRITAQHLSYHAKKKQYVFTGKVKILRDKLVCHADKVIFDETSEIARAYGHIVASYENKIFRGEKLKIHLGTFKSLVINGDLYIKQAFTQELLSDLSHEKAPKLGANVYIFEGRKLFNINKDRQKIECGVFTPCKCDSKVQPWRIFAQKVDIYQDKEKVLLYWPAFRIAEIPLLQFPFHAFSLGTRKTGLLVPSISYSPGNDRGFAFSLPFFWVISDNVDTTITYDYTQQRGHRLMNNLRWVSGKESYGNFYVSYVPYDQYDKIWNRWLINISAKQQIYKRFFSGLSAELVSDPGFKGAYGQGIIDVLTQFSVTKGFLYNAWDDFYAALTFIYYQLVNPLQASGETNFDYARRLDGVRKDNLGTTHKMPKIDLSLILTQIRRLPLALNIDIGYTNFSNLLGARDAFGDYGPEGLRTGNEPTISQTQSGRKNPDGTPYYRNVSNNSTSQDDYVPIYQKKMTSGPDTQKLLNLSPFPNRAEGNFRWDLNEPLFQVQRFVFNPTVLVPLTFIPELPISLFSNYNLIQYYAVVPDQFLLTAQHFSVGADIKTSIHRVFEFADPNKKLKHVIEPRIGYLYQPFNVYSSNTPNYGLQTLSFDDYERLSLFHKLEFRLSNRFILKKSDQYSIPFELVLAQGLDLRSTEERRNDINIFSDSREVGRWMDFRIQWLINVPMFSHNTSFSFHPKNRNISEVSSSTRFYSNRGDAITIDYFYLSPTASNRLFNEDELNLFSRGIFVTTYGISRYNDISFGFTFKVIKPLDIFYSFMYSFETEVISQITYGFQYKSICDCWTFKFWVVHMPNQVVNRLTYYFLLDLATLGSFGG